MAAVERVGKMLGVRFAVVGERIERGAEGDDEHGVVRVQPARRARWRPMTWWRGSRGSCGRGSRAWRPQAPPPRRRLRSRTPTCPPRGVRTPRWSRRGRPLRPAGRRGPPSSPAVEGSAVLASGWDARAPLLDAAAAGPLPRVGVGAASAAAGRSVAASSAGAGDARASFAEGSSPWCLDSAALQGRGEGKGFDQCSKRFAAGPFPKPSRHLAFAQPLPLPPSGLMRRPPAPAHVVRPAAPAPAAPPGRSRRPPAPAAPPAPSAPAHVVRPPAPSVCPPGAFRPFSDVPDIRGARSGFCVTISSDEKGDGPL